MAKHAKILKAVNKIAILVIASFPSKEKVPLLVLSQRIVFWGDATNSVSIVLSQRKRGWGRGQYYFLLF